MYNIGNKHAEKWTKEATMDLLERLMNHIEENPKEFHLGYALVQVGEYPDLYYYLSKKFEDDEDVFRTIKQIEQLLEARIINGSFTGEVKSAAMAIFYLKNKHGYIDKTEVDSNVKLGAEAQGITIGYVDKDGNINHTR